MNKHRVERYLGKALKGLDDTKNCEIRIKDEKTGSYTSRIDKNFRGQISSFGAAVTMGSFKAAVAFMSQKAGSEVERQELIKLLNFVVRDKWEKPEDIVQYVLHLGDKEVNDMKDRFLDASIAVKLALNAFTLV